MMNLAQQSRSTTAWMVDLRNWMGRLIPHQACEVRGADRLSQGEWFTECQRKGDLRGMAGLPLRAGISSSTPSARAEFTALRDSSFLGWTTWVICKIFFPVSQNTTPFKFLLSETEKNTSMLHPTWQVFTNLQKAGSQEHCLSQAHHS